jgi:hypothetical protein
MLLYQIPRSHYLEDKYLMYLYATALLMHLGFLLDKKGPKTLKEYYNMAIQIEENISLFRKGHPFTLDTFSLERLVSLEIFTENSQERREQVINQQNENMVDDPKSDPGAYQGMKNAPKLKCSESDETNTITSGSSS